MASDKLPKYIFISLIPLHIALYTLKGWWAMLRGACSMVVDHKVPSTEEELEAWFHRAFWCEEGPCRASYERNEWGDLSCEGSRITKHYFELYAFMSVDTPGAEARLCQAMYEDFERFGYMGYKLVWRRLPRIEREVIATYGPEMGHQDLVDDASWQPGPDLVYNEFMRTYHAGVAKTPVIRLRMRLCIEDLPLSLSTTLRSHATPGAINTYL